MEKAVGMPSLVVKRIFSWSASYRCLHRRYECRVDHFAFFVAIAAAFICYRRLTN
jgi:hypothetical protein